MRGIGEQYAYSNEGEVARNLGAEGKMSDGLFMTLLGVLLLPEHMKGWEMPVHPQDQVIRPSPLWMPNSKQMDNFGNLLSTNSNVWMPLTAGISSDVGGQWAVRGLGG